MIQIKRKTGFLPLIQQYAGFPRRAADKPSDSADYLFSRRDLIILIVPIIIEQFMDIFMGMADTLMVSHAGETALSAVSLADSVCALMIQVFIALAAGGTIICSQYLGQKHPAEANKAAQQLFLSVMTIAIVISAALFLFRRSLLAAIFGTVSEDVMNAAVLYFSLVTLSFPFFALFQIGNALFMACGNSRYPMAVSLCANIGNIAGNALLIFYFNMGVMGAALSTLLSRVLSAVVIFTALRRQKQAISLTHLMPLQPDMRMIRKILYIGVPSGIENGMFQFGKLVIQSSVSTLGTTLIAANAVDSIFENLSGVAGIGIGIGLMTVVSRCIGANRKDQARYYTVHLALWAEVAIALSCLLLLLLGKPIISLSSLSPEGAAVCWDMMIFITICKPFLWVPGFIPPYCFRAAGDVTYPMIVASLAMWLCRVALTIILIRVAHVGLIAVWIGMFMDWVVRGILYAIRFRKGTWLKGRAA